MENIVIDRTQLRKFGFILAFGLMGIFGLLFPWLKENALPLWPFAIGGVVLIPTLIAPLWLKAIFIPWMKIGNVLGWINTRIILGVIFYGMVTPMGIVMRLLGKDPMYRRYDKALASYRKISVQQPPQHMEKPF